MSSLYFLITLIGVAWLCVWAALPRPWSGGFWWPFDMRQDDQPPPAVVVPPARATRPERRIRR